MKFNLLLKSEIQEYITKNSGTSITTLAFQKNPFPEIDFKIVLNQIEARTKIQKKLFTWYTTNNIIYPSKISVEQTSSETTAKYKSELITGDSIIDLTGGFGVDAYYFSKKVKQVIHCEINQELTEIVIHNLKQLKSLNCNCIYGDSTEILKTLNQKFSTIYIDPSRRTNSKGKVFMLKDCMPNVVELQNLYYQYTNNILIKTAPFLDITAGIIELKNVKTIHILAIDNEVKELLWQIEKDYIKDTTIKTINFVKEIKEIFEYKLNSKVISSFSLPKKYLYEPNSAIMKSGGFSQIGAQFSLYKLHQHSHLYTSDEKIKFPGRVFEIEKKIEYSKSEMKTNLENKKINITIRNFPESVENLRKKWKINDGGNEYCFFTTDINNNKIVLICTKINFK